MTTTDSQLQRAPRWLRPWIGPRRRETTRQSVMVAGLIVLLILTYIPLIYLAILSLKDNGQIYGRFWSFPNPVRWANFAYGARAIWRPC